MPNIILLAAAAAICVAMVTPVQGKELVCCLCFHDNGYSRQSLHSVPMSSCFSAEVRCKFHRYFAFVCELFFVPIIIYQNIFTSASFLVHLSTPVTVE